MPTVLLTRPQEEIPKDTQIFKRFGFEVVSLPLIGFEELEFSPPRLEDFDYLYFGSKRGVRFFLKKVEEIPPSVRVVTVGEKTAEELRKWNLKPFKVLKSSSRELVELARKGQLKRGKILAITPKDYIKDIHRIEEFGFFLKVLPVYKTVFIKYPLSVVEREVKKADIAIFTSPSTFISLLENLQNRKELLDTKIIVAIGKTTAGAIEGRGFKVSFIPSRPNTEILARELREELNGFKGKNVKR
ncbi:MAG TPA: uroporphyrinogen-III synthase [Aquifex aeolicus]|uniref:Uroporphyrinogen-III synthase n=1 Tax=Aquifex aeolicus TaxID=63363 RepID=A0A9D0YP23_AQUAO|nr:uroporphyrinogen-III synthase [Aquificales bacterium]HIP98298.1 uroporphyrinogen-III synthase [Aquifex aeolicus]HIQ26045.1 uroporphyrinogen-III synthase [Aquifex aeolicus]